MNLNYITIVGICLSLTSCANSPPPPQHTAEQKDAIHQAYAKCVALNAEKLDDNKSPADVIGDSIAIACNQQYIAQAMLFVENDNEAVKRQVYLNLNQYRAEAPTRYVLSRRAYLNSHKNKNSS